MARAQLSLWQNGVYADRALALLQEDRLVSHKEPLGPAWSDRADYSRRNGRLGLVLHQEDLVSRPPDRLRVLLMQDETESANTPRVIGSIRRAWTSWLGLGSRPGHLQ